MMKEDKELDKLLDQWETENISQPYLTQRVLSRIASEENESTPFFSSFVNAFLGLQLTLAASVLLLIAVLFTHNYDSKISLSHVERFSALYSSFVDPLPNVDEEIFGSMQPFLNEENMLLSLEWMKSAFDLDREQFQVVAQLHIEYKKDFLSIYNQLVVLKENYNRFEEQRVHSDQIDFLAFYDLLEKRKKLTEEYFAKSNELIQHVSDVLDTRQKALYRKILPKQTFQEKTLPHVGYRTA